MKGPLTGTRVVDLTRTLAGQFCTMLLGDLGAEVLKIEVTGGDLTRKLAGPSHEGESFFFLAFNRNKKSVELDLATPSGRQAFLDLAKVSHVVCDNFRPGVMKRLGADYDTLKQVNPQIICASISGYGHDGPDANRSSFDVACLARSGILSVTGHPGGPPVKPGPAIADMSSGMLLAFGVVSALLQCSQTGQGQKVDVSLLDACIALMGTHISHYYLSGEVPGPLGTGHIGLSPHGAYKTANGYIAIAGAWPRIARVVGADWLIDDPRFNTLAARQEHREELDRALQEQFSTATTEQWLELFEVEDIPGAPLNTVDKAVSDPQVRHNNMILTLKHKGGEIRVAGSPVKMSRLEEEHQAPPALGEHTESVLTGILGYSEAQIAKMRAEQEKHAAELQQHLVKLI